MNKVFETMIYSKLIKVYTNQDLEKEITDEVANIRATYSDWLQDRGLIDYAEWQQFLAARPLLYPECWYPKDDVKIHTRCFQFNISCLTKHGIDSRVYHKLGRLTALPWAFNFLRLGILEIRSKGYVSV